MAASASATALVGAPLGISTLGAPLIGGISAYGLPISSSITTRNLGISSLGGPIVSAYGSPLIGGGISTLGVPLGLGSASVIQTRGPVISTLGSPLIGGVSTLGLSSLNGWGAPLGVSTLGVPSLIGSRTIIGAPAISTLGLGGLGLKGGLLLKK